MVSIKFLEVGHVRRPDVTSVGKESFEFKRVFDMPIERLQQLHGAMIEVEVDVAGSLRSLSGKGIYDDNDPDVGPALRILVDDPSGNFEFLLLDSEWVGTFESSDLPGCDYRISLASRTTC